MAETILLFRFNDHDSDELVRPVDEVGALEDLVKTGADYPSIVEAALGFGRSFSSVDEDGLFAIDVDSGATLLTHSMSIQVALAWDIDSANAYGDTGTIYARGKGTAAAEYLSGALELRVIDAAARIGEIRWVWMDLAGAVKVQAGGHFQMPATGYAMFTATRRWVSSSSVVLRYYMGDELLAEVESVDGEIGGGTTGTSSIGTRYDAGGAVWGNYFDGVIDEIRVVDDELAAEEVRMTWRRITVEQPNGYLLVRQMHDPGFPISQDPASRAQRETRLVGHALGFAAAQAENVRENILPDRAYGEVLERWEDMTKQPLQPGDDLDTRRARVCGKIRQRLGASPPGVRDATDELLDTDGSNLEIIAFSPTTSDAWATLEDTRWRHNPIAQISIAANALRYQSNTDRFAFDNWITSLESVGGNGRGVAILTKLTPTTIAASGEVGVLFLSSVIKRDADGFMFGLANDAGTYRITTTPIVSGVAQAATNRAVPGLVTLWLLLVHDDDDATATASYSTVGPTGPWTTFATLAGCPASFHWAGMFARSYAGTPAIDVAFDDTLVRAPFSDRPNLFYVLRDVAEPGDPDYVGADAVLRGLKQAHTEAHAVRTLIALYDDDDTGYDLEPMGGI